MGEFLTWGTVLLGFLVLLAVGFLPLVGIGVTTYYALRRRVSRRALRALVVGIPLASVLGYYLVVDFAVLVIQIISQ